MIVYIAINKHTGKVYVGKTTKTLPARIRQHVNDANCRQKTYFHKALVKHGADAFMWSIVWICDNLSKLDLKEKEIIKMFEPVGAILYNLTKGGDGGSRPGSMNPRYGKKLSEETKKKVSDGLKKYYAEHPMIGKPHTEESKRKLSEAKKGKPLLKSRGKTKHNGASNPSARKVKCVTTGEIFDYATQAARKYGHDLSSIVKCCKNKIASTKGCIYEYIE